VEDVHIAIGRRGSGAATFMGDGTRPEGPRRSIWSRSFELEKTARGEIRAIDDVRSTAAYREHVTGNLVVEFLEGLSASGEQSMSHVLAPLEPAFRGGKRRKRFGACCGSAGWAHRGWRRGDRCRDAGLAAGPPSDEIWLSLETPDWMEAFSKHPRIGGAEGASPGPRHHRRRGRGKKEQRKGGGCWRFNAARIRGGESRVRAAVPAGVHRVRKAGNPRPRF